MSDLRRQGIGRRRPLVLGYGSMAEEDLRVLFAEDPERGWRAFIDRFTPTLLGLIERAGVTDRDEVMEIYVLACERLSEHDYAPLRRRDPAKGSLAGWLAVVVRRVAVDWVRSRSGRRRLFGVVRRLGRFEQRVFELYYWDGRLPTEIGHLLAAETGRPASIADVLDALAQIDAVLSERHRSELLSLAARRRRPVSLETDDEEMAIDPPADAPDPESALQIRELERRLADALAALPTEDAAIVSLKYVEGLTRPQIQRLLRLPDLSEHRIRAIVGKLRALLSGAGVGAPHA